MKTTESSENTGRSGFRVGDKQSIKSIKASVCVSTCVIRKKRTPKLLWYETQRKGRIAHRDEEEPPELELGGAGDLLGDGVAAAGQDAGGDGLGAQRVRLQLPHVGLPRHRHHLRHLG